MMKWRGLLLAGTVILLTGCGGGAEPVKETDPAVVSGSAEAEEKGLASVARLLGMEDSETKTMLGGGKENWTEDHAFYIGRIFQAEIDGKEYPVYTTCSKEGIVESVSVHIVSGERDVTEEEIAQWVERISEYTGVSPSEESSYSEGGSKQRAWEKENKIVKLYSMKDQLSISFQKQFGELEEGRELS